ncbi:MAG: sensor histidine kinase [Limisphaerales bacterium]
MTKRPVKFLLVDDLEGNLLALEGLLRREGLELLKAQSGAEALELLLVHDVALTLLDVQMPEMDGFTLAELMRGSERTRHVPIIFVTAGMQDNQRRFRGYELGAVDFLYKPIDPHILKSKADVFFELARQREELKARADENARLLESLSEAQRKLREHADELEERVVERTAKLQELVNDLEHFSYTITHDMRAPLRAMQAFGNILREDYARCLDDEGKDFLRRITQAANRMDNLIADALNYTKAVQSELELEPVDVKPLIQSIVESYPHLQAPEAEIEMTGQFPPVLGNKAGLTQCFSNLLGNAVKFVPSGKVPKVRVWAEERGEFIRFWVEDNGIGIPPELQGRVFDMFQKLNHDYEGTGIGLALVKKVSQRMQGKVGVDSRQGEGSRFWLELRRANQPMPEEVMSSEKTSKNFS